MLFVAPELQETDHRALKRIEDQDLDLRPLVAASRPWSGLLRRVALARAFRGSNTIEGFTVSVDDAFAALNDQEPMDAEEISWQAVRGYRDLGKWPGRWRPDQVYLFDAANEETVYVGPDADQVPALIDELVTEINTMTAAGEPMITAAMAHLNLVMIHPFKDGNGRMARCLQTLMLAAAGTTAAPEFASIEEYLGTHELDYDRVLQEVGGGGWNPHRDTRPWVRFTLTAHYRQALRVERRAEMAGKLWVRAEKEVAKAGLPERCVQPLTYCLSGLYLRNSTYRQLAPDITQNVASRDLIELVNAGLLMPEGEKRGRRYVPSPAMREVAVAFREEVNRRLPASGDPYA